MVTGEMKVATVDVESSDNMATLPVGRTLGGTGPGGGGPGSHSDTAGKDNAANKEMELKNVMPKPLQKLVLSLYSSCHHFCYFYVSESKPANYKTFLT